MGEMARRLRKWFITALTGLTLGVLIPAQAWAADNGAAQLVVEAARKSRRGGFGFGTIGIVCCLGVIVVIAVIVYLISRKRRRR
ncbi:hypothetical protein [Actinoplanes sp. CA-252034]|uniref:hypothetical protein n=1 Tax=Actinoplanes sp. CA-252034 TaxID=3239906 RepID=UPI003D97B730